MVAKKIKNIFFPERFQGFGKKSNYFEGWYYKCVSPDGLHAFAIIPGIAIDKTGKGHAFIQILDGKARTTTYHTFALESFSSAEDAFEIRIENNHFSASSLELYDLPLAGKLTFHDPVLWPKKWYSPGIMGPFSFAPFMECYHGIVSMGHRMEGSLHYGNQHISFMEGKGYIEKDWGQSFPSAYVWMQSNHFDNDAFRFKLSVARIPWLTGDFTGFIAGFYDGEKLIRFTTYNGCHLLFNRINEGGIHVAIDHPQYTLEVRARKEKGTLLASPIHGFMNGRIEESMNALLEVQLHDKRGNILHHSMGIHSGLEIAGKVELIVKP